MARRSPLNKRYQKDTKIGSTRKSAAAAKPTRSNASGSSSSSSSSRARTRSSSSARSTPRVQLPPEIKRLQKFSFGMLGVAVLLSVLYLWKFRTSSVLGYVIIGLAYGLMFAALYLDFAKVRPALKAAQRGETLPSRSRGATTAPTKKAKAPSAIKDKTTSSRTDWKSDEKPADH